MATSEQLRKNTEQHKPKNTKSKKDDKAIYLAQARVQEYLYDRFSSQFKHDYFLQFDQAISFGQMQKVIRNSRLRLEFDTQYSNRTIKPDGGILVLRRQDDIDYYKIVLIAEVKRQGTNKDREKEGKRKQSQGNAVERLGKNLIGIRAMLQHESITPFVCFFWGCDFQEGVDEYVPSKISMMNEFYQSNHTHVFKKDGNSDHSKFSPVSMYYREEQWDTNSMFDIMKEIAETAMRYYLF